MWARENCDLEDVARFKLLSNRWTYWPEYIADNTLIVDTEHFHVDHSALLYLVSKQSLTGKLARWTLLLQEFEFDIIHRPGLQHVVANYLSPLELGEPGTGVRHDFPEAQQFREEAENSTNIDEEIANLWITEMTLFLSKGLRSEGMSLDERKQLPIKSQNFCLLKETLYHKGADGIWRRARRVV